MPQLLFGTSLLFYLIKFNLAMCILCSLLLHGFRGGVWLRLLASLNGAYHKQFDLFCNGFIESDRHLFSA